MCTDLSTARELERGFVTPYDCSAFAKLTFDDLINSTFKVISRMSLLVFLSYAAFFPIIFINIFIFSQVSVNMVYIESQLFAVTSRRKKLEGSLLAKEHQLSCERKRIKELESQLSAAYANLDIERVARS